MKKNELYIYIVLNLAILIPSPARLAYGLILILLFNLLLFSGILFKRAVEKFFSEESMQTAFVLFFLFFVTVVFRQFVILYSAPVAFVLGIIFYIPLLTSFILGNILTKTKRTIPQDISVITKKALIFTVFSILFYSLRDIVAYGTITFPIPDGIKEISIFSRNGLSFINAFWGSIPGGLVLTAVIYSIIAFIMRKLEILETTKEGVNR